jgi:predicted nuclease with TOPRIM domain
MSLTRKMLKGMGLTEEQVDSIIEEHTAVTDALKEKATQYEADAKRLASVEKELNDLKAGGDDWEEKYNAEHKAFEDYKKDIEGKAELDKVKAAYKALLKAQNVSEKRIDTIIKLTDFADLRLTKEGKIANEDKVIEKIKEDWSDLISTESEHGTNVETPPSGSKTMTREEIMKIKDTSKRQEAIANNLELFGR